MSFLTAFTEEGMKIEIPMRFSHYHVQRFIGEGSSSVVITVEDEEDPGYELAVKVATKKDKDAFIKNIENEIATVQKINHKYITEYYDVVYQDDLIFLVMEYCTGGDLLSKIIAGSLSLEEKKRIFKQAVEAVQYLHKSGISHGDLKPENILLDGEGNVKLTDFGFAKSEEKSMDFSGTLYYAPPELFVASPFSPKKADIWSLGVVLYTMITGQFPWAEGDDASYVVDQITHADFIIPKKLYGDALNLFYAMCQIDPLNRATLDQVLNSEFLKDADNDKYSILYAETDKLKSSKSWEFDAIPGLEPFSEF